MHFFFCVEFLNCLVCQIASLKAALARKDGEAEPHFPQSVNTSSGQEIPKLKSYASSPPIQRGWSSGGRKQPKDDSSSMEVTCYLP